MQIIEEVFSNLSSWGSDPVLIEPRRNESTLIISAEELLNSIRALSRELHGWGILRRSPVLLFLDNSVDFVLMFLSLLNLGAIPVPGKIEYRTMELDEIFHNAKPQAVVCENYHLPIVEEYCRRSSLIVRDRGRFSLRNRGEEKKQPEEIADEIVSINYTYRGYGYPLGALLPQEQYLHGAKVVQDELAGNTGDVMMVLLPLSHIFPMVCGLFLCLLYRITALIAHTLHPRLIFEYINRYRVNYMTAVPEIYELLWRCRQMAPDLSSLQLLFSGGSCLSAELYHKIYKDFGVYLAHGYGLTEFTPISRNSANHNRVGTVGPICSGIEVKIDDPTPDGSGEILFKTKGMSRGYYRRPAETEEVFSSGWFRTGDLGHIDNGHLVFDREKKNTRKVNGNMVDLKEVHKVMLSIAGIQKAHVAYKEGHVYATIKRAGKMRTLPDTTTIKKEMSHKLAGYKIPRSITIIY